MSIITDLKSKKNLFIYIYLNCYKKIMFKYSCCMKNILNKQKIQLNLNSFLRICNTYNLLASKLAVNNTGGTWFLLYFKVWK